MVDETVDQSFIDPRYADTYTSMHRYGAGHHSSQDYDDEPDGPFFAESMNMGGNVDYDLVGEDGTYTQANEMNGYDGHDDDSDDDKFGRDNDYAGDTEQDHDPDKDDDVVDPGSFTGEADVVSSDTSFEDPDEALSREQAIKSLFESNLNKANKHSENLNFIPSNHVISVSSNPYNHTVSGNHFIMNDQHHGKAKLNKLITDYLSNPSDVFVIKGVQIDELPEIMKTMTGIKELVVTQCDLKSLLNLPPNVIKLDVRYNRLTELMSAHIPPQVVELNANKNDIRMIDLSGSHRIKIINVSNNPLTNLILFPPNCEEIHVTSSELSSTKCFSDLKNLAILKLNLSHIESIDDLPDSIVDLSASRTMIGHNKDTHGTVSRLPKNLMKFVCHSSGIKGFSFDAFPVGMSHFDVYDNDLQSMPILPDVMSYVDISKNRLVCVSNVPTKVQNYDCNNNPVLQFTPDQTKIIEELQRNIETTIVLNTDDDRADFNFSGFGVSGFEKLGYNTRSSDGPIDSTVRDLFGDSGRSVPGQTQSRVTLHDTNARALDTANSFFDSRRPAQTMGGQSTPGTTQSSTGTQAQGQTQSDRDRMNEYFGSMRTGGFGNFGTRSSFNTRFGDQTGSQSTSGQGGPGGSGGPGTQSSQPTRPQYPPHILKLLASDNFSPTKDPNRRIKHAHIYYV